MRQERHWLDAAGAQIAQGQCAQPFGQCFTLWAGQERVVRKAGHCAAEGLNDLDLRGRVRNVVRAAHHVCHAHFRVIDDGGQCVEELAIAAD